MVPEYDVEDFKKKFPRLADEMFSGNPKQLKLRMRNIDPWRGYVPTVVDYIRRCKSVEEAFEVIEYLVRRNELSTKEADELKEKLRNGGIEAFGGRKEDDYYYRYARRYWASLVSYQRSFEEEEVEEST
ncbi:MAG: DUF2095 family protein [Desulfurococcaceae archaeon]|jgi:hypothetical protein